jgi:formylglycine-generating enzyme required for sulfatase activity
MRIVSATVLLVGLAASAAEPTPTYPQWDGKETVAEYAKRAGLEPAKTLDLGNGVKLELVLIPAGLFTMGDENKIDPVPVHRVKITKPFYLGKFEVTQEQYQQVMDKDPSQFKGPDLPVEMVSWNDTQEFCKNASEKTGQTVRLPTEAEWEDACRAGRKTTYNTGDTDADLALAAWYDKNSGSATHPVGRKTPNAWGLYDMHGNVWEWCMDRFGDYKAEAVTDPPGPAQGADRTTRGGSWFNAAAMCRSVHRFKYSPVGRSSRIGFRVAASVPPKAP